MAYGHGISVTLIQLAHALPRLCTGWRSRAALPPADGRPSADRQTSLLRADSRKSRAMLELVVLPGGTAPRHRFLAIVSAARQARPTSLMAEATSINMSPPSSA